MKTSNDYDDDDYTVDPVESPYKGCRSKWPIVFLVVFLVLFAGACVYGVLVFLQLDTKVSELQVELAQTHAMLQGLSSGKSSNAMSSTAAPKQEVVFTLPANPASVDAGNTDMATPSPVVVATEPEPEPEPEPKHDAVVVPPVVTEPLVPIAGPANVDAGNTDMATPSPVVVASVPEQKHDAVVVPPVVTEPLVPMPVASIASPASVDAGKKEPEPSVSKPTPRLEEWQEKLVKEYEGLKMLPMKPRKIDMAQFDGVSTKLLRKMAKYTRMAYSDWFMSATMDEVIGLGLSDAIYKVFRDQDDASYSFRLVKKCLRPQPSTACIGISRVQLEEHIKAATAFLGEEVKPFELIYKMRLKQGHKRR